ncbi:MAG: hypothetical protein HQL76_05685 [Magnetococcales bacterium]|nr:hypothetical protein [Magnetococcales bacterium]
MNPGHESFSPNLPFPWSKVVRMHRQESIPVSGRPPDRKRIGEETSCGNPTPSHDREDASSLDRPHPKTTLPEPPVLLVLGETREGSQEVLSLLRRRIEGTILSAHSEAHAIEIAARHHLALLILDGDRWLEGHHEFARDLNALNESHPPCLLYLVTDPHRALGTTLEPGPHRFDLVPRPVQEPLLLTKIRACLDLHSLEIQRDQAKTDFRQIMERLVEREERLRTLKEVNETLQQKNSQLHRELEQSNQGLQQFTYAASHDLQEPLRLVSGYVQLLARRYRGALDTKADSYIDFVSDGVRHMQALIDSLLEFSRIGTHSGDIVPTDCERILLQTLQSLNTTITTRSARITHDPLPIVHADPGQLFQVFRHLLDNALKFQGDQTPEIHIGAHREGAKWIFSIRDNGIGIAPQFAERVFLIFQKLHPRSRFPGTGIGLTICKRVVERHGGRIWVEPGEAQGTLMRFSLPEDPSELE